MHRLTPVDELEETINMQEIRQHFKVRNDGDNRCYQANAPLEIPLLRQLSHERKFSYEQQLEMHKKEVDLRKEILHKQIYNTEQFNA